MAREKQSGKEVLGIKDIRTRGMKDILANDKRDLKDGTEKPSDPCSVQKYKKSKSMCSKSIFVKFLKESKDKFKDEEYNFCKQRF